MRVQAPAAATAAGPVRAGAKALAAAGGAAALMGRASHKQAPSAAASGIQRRRGSDVFMILLKIGYRNVADRHVPSG
jgi:hypothetical protein